MTAGKRGRERERIGTRGDYYYYRVLASVDEKKSREEEKVALDCDVVLTTPRSTAFPWTESRTRKFE